MGTLNLPDKMQKESGQSDHSILRKHQKCVECTQNGQFDHLFDNFSGTRGWNDLIPFAPCNATSDTSLQYPHTILWWHLKITIFAGLTGQKWQFSSMLKVCNVVANLDFAGGALLKAVSVFSSFPFPLFSTFLIDGGFKSKNLFSAQKPGDRHLSRPRRPFWGPQVVWHCRVRVIFPFSANYWTEDIIDQG